MLRRRPGAHLVETPEEVATADVDVVVVLTPPPSHAELCLLALEHGKHVVCEKPVAMSRARGRAGRGARPRARPALPGGAVRPARADVPRPLDAGSPRRDRCRPLCARSLRKRRLALGGLVPLGRRGTAGRERDLQPQEPHGAAGAGGGGARGRVGGGAGPRGAVEPRSSSRTPTSVTPCCATRAGRSPRSSPRRRSSATAVPGSSSTARKARRTCSATTGTRAGSSCGATRPAAGRSTRRSTARGSGPTGCANACSRCARAGRRCRSSSRTCTCWTSSRRRAGR